eukprot:4182256-Pyramimonas_sp.AAC.1
MAQYGSKRASYRKLTSKMAQDSPICLKMAAKMLQEAPRLQDGSKWPRSASRRPPRGQHLSNTDGQTMKCTFSPFYFRLRGLKTAPRELHTAS